MKICFILPFLLGSIIKIAVFGLDEFSCIQKDTKIDGKKLEVISSSSWEDCQMKCQDNSDCKDWTFEEKSKNCALFNDPDDVVDDHDFISGPRDCTDFVNNTMPLDRVDPATAAALGSAAIDAGATLLTETAGEASIYLYPGNKYVKIGPGNCWRDGGGACPNGNCLDSNGRAGIILREEVFKCRWYCVHRPQCRYQTCCEVVSKKVALGSCKREYGKFICRGNDIGSARNMPSNEACESWCLGTTGCVGWTRHRNGLCYRKHKDSCRGSHGDWTTGYKCN